MPRLWRQFGKIESICVKLFPQAMDKSEKHAEIPPCG
jgi:hypothetical protein